MFSETIELRGHIIDSLILDRKSTPLNSSHTVISYAVFCLKKKTETDRLVPWESSTSCSSESAPGQAPWQGPGGPAELGGGWAAARTDREARDARLPSDARQ